ncbi:MAG TPA: hypothetical protein VM557_13365 [Thermoanaerobaculia bacterium]|nr:hypothetical protein [Thermoanaerobaculia bacterium]
MLDPRFGWLMLAALCFLPACRGGETGSESTTEMAVSAEETETTGGNYGDKLVGARKKAADLAAEESKRAKEVDEAVEQQ